MPKPPPRSSVRASASASAPCSSCSSARSPTTRCAATSKPGGVEDLRADVAVQPDQPQPAAREHPAHRLRGVAAGRQREAELLVLVRGGDELVGVRLDADGHPDQHRDATGAARRGERGQPGDLVERVEHDARRSRPRPRRSSAVDLLLPCSAIRSAGKPARSATASSPPLQTSRRRPSVGHPAGDLGAQERLGRVVHAASAPNAAAKSAAGRGSRPRRRRTAGCRKRSASSRTSTPGQLAARRRRRGRRAAARPRAASSSSPAASAGAGRPVSGGAWMSACSGPAGCALRPHIRSGALTPSTARPLASTWRAAAHSHSRARCSVGGLLVAHRQHPAGVVELVVGAGQLLQVAGDPVRLAQLGRGGDDRGELAERADQVALARVLQQPEVRRVRHGRRPGRRRCGPARRAGRARTGRRRPGCRWSAGSTGPGRGRAWSRPRTGSARTGRRRRRPRRPGRPW